MSEVKIFCVGFHKTGTTSLAVALEELGYRVTGPNGVNDDRIATNALRMAERLIPRYDAFQDNPWPILYKELAERYPGGKFILTVRDPQSWIKSQVRHFGSAETPMRRWIYGAGAPLGNEEIYLARYLTHNREVMEYFGRESERFCVLNLMDGDGWEKLCGFLGKAVPSTPFPHANSAQNRERVGADKGLYGRFIRLLGK